MLRKKTRMALKLSFIMLAVPFVSMLEWIPYGNQNFAQAQYFTGPVSAALGGAGVAAVNTSEGVFLNPATLAHAPTFESGLAYQDGYLENKTHRTLMGVSLIDNSDGILLPGAISYFQGGRTFPTGTSTEDQLWQISLGQFVMRNFALGVNIYRVEHRIYGAKDEVQWNGTLGLHYTLSPFLAVAFVFYNPLSPDKDLPVEIQALPETRVGLQFAPRDFVRLRLDISRPEQENPDKKGRIYTGVEMDPADLAVFRVGAQFDDYEKRNSVTFGLGFNGPRLKINYSLQKAIKGLGGALHSVDFRVPVW